MREKKREQHPKKNREGVQTLFFSFLCPLPVRETIQTLSWELKVQKLSFFYAKEEKGTDSFLKLLLSYFAWEKLSYFAWETFGYSSSSFETGTGREQRVEKKWDGKRNKKRQRGEQKKRTKLSMGGRSMGD